MVMCVVTHITLAQKITGKVIDAIDNNGLPGVNVIVKGTLNGTVTDVEGNYAIEAEGTETILVFSSVGYLTEEIAVGTKTIIDVALSEDLKQLEEIVVVGYGTMRKSDVTGSLVSVTAEENVARQYATVDQMLQGRAAGVQVTSNSGNPGMGVSVRIRGTNSLRGNNEPLYVVDGVIINSAGVDAMKSDTDGNSLQENQNGLNGINPRDIESMEVLKDASATAIYGSRGSNGVVLITTKQGIKGKMKVDAYVTTSVSEINKKLPVMNGVDYAMYRNEVNLMSGNDAPYHIDGNDVYEITYPNGLAEVSDVAVQQVNWQDEIYQYGKSYNAGIAFSGGSDKGSYYISAGYNDQGGIVENARIQSGDFRVNVTQNLSKKLKVDARVSTYYQLGNFAQAGSRAGTQRGFIANVVKYRPIVGSDVDDFGSELGLSNPLSWINDFEDRAKELRINGSFSLTYDLPVKGLKYQLRAGANYRDKSRRKWYGLTTFQGDQNNGKLSMSDLKKSAYNIDNLLLYNRSFARIHRINATLGFTSDGIQAENGLYEVIDFAATDFTVDGPEYGAVVTRPLQTSLSSERILSYLGRVNYALNEKYIATVTFRADGSSKFAEGNKYSFFPSASFAWRAIDENFIQSLGVFDDLKLRAGWGKTGNQAINAYQTFQNYGSSYYASPSNATIISFVGNNIANPDLVWETTEQFNIGLDMGFFAGRLNSSVDVYYKETKDLLQQIALPTSTGFQNMLINRGTISNKGIDFSLDGVVLDKNGMNLTIGGNISVNRNKILELGIPEAPIIIDGEEQMRSYYLGDNVSTGWRFKCPANVFIVDEAMGVFYGYETDGIYQSGEEIPAGFQAGDIRFIDQNQDSVITSADRTIIGDPNPDFIFGFNANFTWKRFSASMLINGIYGNEIANGNLLELNIAEGTSTNLYPAAYHDAWRPDAQSMTHPRVLYAKEVNADGINDRIIEDGSYVRLGNITVGYDLPLEKVFNRAQLYVSGQNLLTVTGYSGYEPEITTFLSNGNIQGVDWNGFPNARTILVGLNLNF